MVLARGVLLTLFIGSKTCQPKFPVSLFLCSPFLFIQFYR